MYVLCFFNFNYPESQRLQVGADDGCIWPCSAVTDLANHDTVSTKQNSSGIHPSFRSGVEVETKQKVSRNLMNSGQKYCKG